MARENINLAILFADIVNSTRLYQTAGNETAQKLIGDCIDLLSGTALKHHGRVIKTIGDEIMCTFQNVDDAARAAIEMNRNIEDMPVHAAAEEFSFSIHVGLQLGPVIMEDEDVFGDAVNVSAHIVTLAKQRQIITTEETVYALNSKLKKLAHYIFNTTVKGKPGECKLYEIIWERIGETLLLDIGGDTLILDNHLELRRGDQVIPVGLNRPGVTLGRHQQNDLTINDDYASRSHARIEYRRGKFVLIDHSKNGTYVFVKGEKSFRLNHDEAPLIGNGYICLGHKRDPNSSGKKFIIHYESREKSSS